MKSSNRDPIELESELMRLNTLIRARRQQLSVLATCPHTDCECRSVWREVTEKKLANQVGKVRKHVRASSNGNGAKPKKARTGSL